MRQHRLTVSSSHSSAPLETMSLSLHRRTRVFVLSVDTCVHPLHGHVCSSSPWTRVFVLSVDTCVRPLRGHVCSSSPWTRVFVISVDTCVRPVRGHVYSSSPWTRVFILSVDTCVRPLRRHVCSSSPWTRVFVLSVDTCVRPLRGHVCSSSPSTRARAGGKRPSLKPIQPMLFVNIFPDARHNWLLNKKKYIYILIKYVAGNLRQQIGYVITTTRLVWFACGIKMTIISYYVMKKRNAFSVKSTGFRLA